MRDQERPSPNTGKNKDKKKITQLNQRGIPDGGHDIAPFDGPECHGGLEVKWSTLSSHINFLCDLPLPRPHEGFALLQIWGKDMV